jgi:hypothetical protein
MYTGMKYKIQVITLESFGTDAIVPYEGLDLVIAVQSSKALEGQASLVATTVALGSEDFK